MTKGNRRWKVVHIGLHEFLEKCFIGNPADDNCEYAGMVQLPEIPYGTKIVNTAFDADRCTMAVIISHDDFPEIPLYEAVPEFMSVTREFRQLRIIAEAYSFDPKQLTVAGMIAMRDALDSELLKHTTDTMEREETDNGEE